MKFILSVAVSANLILAASVRAANIAAPGAASVFGVPTIMAAPVPVLSFPALSPSGTLSFGLVPTFAVPSLAVAPAPVNCTFAPLSAALMPKATRPGTSILPASVTQPVAGSYATNNTPAETLGEAENGLFDGSEKGSTIELSAKIPDARSRILDLGDVLQRKQSLDLGNQADDLTAYSTDVVDPKVIAFLERSETLKTENFHARTERIAVPNDHGLGSTRLADAQRYRSILFQFGEAFKTFSPEDIRSMSPASLEDLSQRVWEAIPKRKVALLVSIDGLYFISHDWLPSLTNRPFRMIVAESKDQLHENLISALKDDEEISHLILHGHGSPGSIFTSNHEEIGIPIQKMTRRQDSINAESKDEYDSLFEGIRGRLANGAKVVVSACNFLNGKDNMVFSRVAALRSLLGLKNGFLYGHSTVGTIPWDLRRSEKSVRWEEFRKSWNPFALLKPLNRGYSFYVRDGKIQKSTKTTLEKFLETFRAE